MGFLLLDDVQGTLSIAREDCECLIVTHQEACQIGLVVDHLPHREVVDDLEHDVP